MGPRWRPRRRGKIVPAAAAAAAVIAGVVKDIVS